jgi:hypothetical protein
MVGCTICCIVGIAHHGVVGRTIVGIVVIAFYAPLRHSEY